MTKQTWDDGDYIKNVFDKWLEAPGEFTVLEDDGQIVGCTKLSIIKPGNLWLEGIRVDPNKRRKGYAKILADYQLDLCKKLGFEHLNLSTWYQNESVKMLKKYPFQKIHDYKVMTYDLDETCDYISDNNVDYNQIMDYFKPLFNKAYYACDWTFFTLDDLMIKTFFDRGEIYKHGLDYLIISDLYNKENSLSIVYHNDINDELMSIVNHLKKTKNKDYLMTMTDDQNKVTLLKEKGFEGYDDEPFDVYLYEFKED
nr:GNAT family N-acetyltransferase [Acidaminobacter sp. JC074]